MDESFAEALESIDWFGACGQPFCAPLLFAVEQVSSWPRAIEACNAQDWEDVTLEARNQLTGFLHVRHPDAYQRWNSIAVSAKARLDSPLRKSIWEPFADRNGFGKAFVDSVTWDVLAAVMEHEYRHCKGRPDFFLRLLQVYRAGHFPCGWSGDWPGGTLLVW